MRPHLRYFSYVVRHKWYVLRAGLKLGGIPLWRLVIHDWSKFLPSEWFAYAEFFYGPKELDVATGKFLRLLDRRQHYYNTDIESLASLGRQRAERVMRERKRAFEYAWLKHQNRQPHHWNYWVLRNDSGQAVVLDMPEQYAREMVADWMGAGRAITGHWDVFDWYENNKRKLKLSKATRRYVEDVLYDEAHAWLEIKDAAYNRDQLNLVN